MSKQKRMVFLMFLFLVCFKIKGAYNLDRKGMKRKIGIKKISQKKAFIFYQLSSYTMH